MTTVSWQDFVVMDEIDTLTLLRFNSGELVLHKCVGAQG